MKINKGYIYDYKMNFRVYATDVFEASGYREISNRKMGISNLFQDRFDRIHEKYSNVIFSVQNLDTMYDRDCNDVFIVFDIKVIALDEAGVKIAKKIIKNTNKYVNKWNKKGYKSRSCRKTFDVVRASTESVGDSLRFYTVFVSHLNKLTNRLPAYDGVNRF